MNAKPIVIREAKIEDAPLIAWVVATAIGSEGTVRRYCGNAGLAIFETLARAEVSQYSYKNALIAEVDGVPAGAIVGYDGARLHELRPLTFEVIRKQSGNIVQIEEETQAGEFYLDSLAVRPEFRGNGIAGKLIAAICEKAFADGHKRTGLIVDKENPKAEKLYRSLGFLCIGGKTFCGHSMRHLQKSAE